MLAQPVGDHRLGQDALQAIGFIDIAHCLPVVGGLLPLVDGRGDHQQGIQVTAVDLLDQPRLHAGSISIRGLQPDQVLRPTILQLPIQLGDQSAVKAPGMIDHGYVALFPRLHLHHQNRYKKGEGHNPGNQEQSNEKTLLAHDRYILPRDYDQCLTHWTPPLPRQRERP